MTYQEFIRKVVEDISDYFLLEEIEQIKTEEVVKNNGISHTALLILQKDEEISPNIYLESYYESYNEGVAYEEVLRRIAEDYKEAKSQTLDFDARGYIENYDSTKIFARIVNFDRNHELFKDVPCIPFYDLAITFRYLVKNDEDGIGSLLIKNSDMERWQLSTEELFRLAKENTMKLFPPKIRTLNDIVENCCGSYEPIGRIPEIYVLSNKQGINGASLMLYKSLLLDIAGKIGGNYYVLPSSVHELLFIPETTEICPEFLRETVREVNASAVSNEDFLSDEIYYFEKEKASLFMVNEGLDSQ